MKSLIYVLSLALRRTLGRLQPFTIFYRSGQMEHDVCLKVKYNYGWWPALCFLLSVFAVGCTCSEIPKETGTLSPTENRSSSDEKSDSERNLSDSVQSKRLRSGVGPSRQPAKNIQERVLPSSSSEKGHANSGRRIVAIGDLHGDIAATRSAFRLAGAIDGDDKWIGGELIVVQTGDQLDRGDDEKRIFDLLDRLQIEAKQAGGEVHILNGNHEYMNALGDFRYVTPGAMEAFSQIKGLPRKHPAVMALPDRQQGRRAAFLPGKGPVARQLADRKVILIKGESVFVHGGVLPKYVSYGVDRINGESKQWLLGELSNPPTWLVDPQGPVWTRAYSDHPSNENCGLLHEALRALGAKRMVVGHTVQKTGIQSACDGEVWMIDVGMARAYGGTAEVLEIVGDQVRAIK